MREFLYKLLGSVLLIGSLLFGWIWMTYDEFANEPLSLAEARMFVVPPGSSAASVGNRLAAQGLITQPSFFRWLARLEGKAASIQAGEYRLEPGISPMGALLLFSSGRTFQHELTLVEGWNLWETLAAIQAHPAIEQTLTGEGSRDERMMALAVALGEPADTHLEGRFLPDTYHFPRGTTDIAFLRRAQAAMDVYLSEAWLGRDREVPYANPYEALIMASIVEKETGVPEERASIAGVFVRRLKKKMLLQTDPTVIYGMGEVYDGNIRRADLRRDTPYNTYTRKGLPPTPIAMPGREAINAALHPLDGKALYFVATGEGRHVFSDTLEEHNAAVRKYQLSGRR